MINSTINIKKGLFNHYLKNRNLDLWGVRLKLKGYEPEIQEIRNAIFSYSGDPDHLVYATHHNINILDRCLCCIVCGFFNVAYTGYTKIG